MRSLVAPLWKFVGQPPARRGDAPRGGCLGDWQRWTRAERIAVVVMAVAASLVALLPLLF